MSCIGVDVGTSRVKAVRFDDDFRPIDSAAETSTVLRPGGGRSEQDMNGVWDAVARVLSTVATRSDSAIAFVAITAQGDGCWLVDDEIEPVGSAMLWNDNRAASIVERWQSDGVLDTAFAINGCLAAPGIAHAQLRWTQEHEPERLTRASTLLSCGSWVYAKLTGRVVLDMTEAANPFFDARTQKYSPELLDLFEIDSLGRLLPEVVNGPSRVGRLCRELAEPLGLPVDTAIVLAPYDVPATAIGTGVVDTGRAFAVLGTTLCVGTVADSPRLDRPVSGMTLPGAGSGRWLTAYATMTGTEVLDWTARLLGLPDAGAVVALAATSDRPDLPLVLPYLSPAGERSPFLDTTIRGSMTALDTSHTPADVARAVLDGLTLAVTDCLRAGACPATLALSGGGAASELWCQAICDAAGVPVTRPDVAEVGARGAVLSAATDLGLYDTIADATAAAVRPGVEHVPDPASSARFDDVYDRFVEARRTGG